MLLSDTMLHSKTLIRDYPRLIVKSSHDLCPEFLQHGRCVEGMAYPGKQGQMGVALL
jgi:hypothetical protein